VGDQIPERPTIARLQSASPWWRSWVCATGSLLEYAAALSRDLVRLVDPIGPGPARISIRDQAPTQPVPPFRLVRRPSPRAPVRTSLGAQCSPSIANGSLAEALHEGSSIPGRAGPAPIRHPHSSSCPVPPR
jgi:hypothetical protein